MPLRDESKYNIAVVNEPKEVSDIREIILNSFNDLVFVDDGHKYYLGDEELMSVSEFTHRFEEEFDADYQAAAYALKHGQTKEYWLDEWKYKNLKSTITGTQVHAFAESKAWLYMGHPENIVEDNKYKYIPEKGWLIPTRHKEESVVKFWEEFPQNMYVVLPETKVYSSVNKSLPRFKENYAGTFDLLLYYKHPTDPQKSGLLICDWKTNADIYKDFARSRKKMMKPPFSSYYEEPYSAYTIQLNAYQIPLEDLGLKVIGRRIIWLKDNGTYEIVKVDDVTSEIRNYLA